MLIFAQRLPHFSHLKSEISDLKSRAESISRQLRAWADSLQDSPIKGQRYLNEKTRRAYQQASKSDAFWDKLAADHERRLKG